MPLRVREMARFIAKTEGVSAAFIRELMRKAAVYAVDEGMDLVEDRHLDEALRELVVHGGELTKSVLGATSLKTVSS
jgi:hypothetical protein